MKKTGFIPVSLLAGAMLAHGQFVPPSGSMWSGRPANFTPENYQAVQIGNGYQYVPLRSVSFSGTNLFQLIISYASVLGQIALPNLQTIDVAHSFGGLFQVQQNPSLTNLSAPILRVLGNGTVITGNPLLASINFSGLVSSPTAVQISGTAMRYLSLPSCTNLNALAVNTSTVLTNAVFPKLISSGSVDFHGDSALSTVSLPSYNPSSVAVDSYNACALTASAIDSLLILYVNATASFTGSIDLSGGTSATPDSTGLAYIATLRGQGATILHN